MQKETIFKMLALVAIVCSALLALLLFSRINFQKEIFSPLNASILFFEFSLLILISFLIVLFFNPKFRMRRISIRKRVVREVEDIEGDIGKELRKIEKKLKKLF